MNIKALLFLLTFPLLAIGEENMEWPFDQGPSVAAITTKQVVIESLPILQVVHYEDDHSWAFTCGTTSRSEDAMIVGMAQILKIDPELKLIADLPPGWRATRESVNSKWVRTKIDET